ncbi:MAG TPA: hypothetical protein DD490_31625 [Acidobacteria bacterium]|nr:hypothetical protein [Acidobacteriota bacterium]
MNEPEIKTVEMVRSIRDAHYEQLKDSSPAEKIAFFREKARSLYVELGMPERQLDDRRPDQAPKPLR